MSDARKSRENRLGGETSPYLRLHRHNPVDWFPWGEEAIEKARRENKPIFLSVGYSTCYWCHVMERESFSDSGVAQLMNEHFVNVKVDREERPELDEIYMAATQVFTGQGGWPNSVFLDPSLRPFFAGTYFPPFDAHGRPSFRTVLLSMKNAWDTRRDDVDTQAAEMAEAMRRMLEERAQPASSPPPTSVADASKEALLARFDAEHGGFGSKPKFPTPSNLFLLLDFAETGDAAAGRALDATLDAMARGGIYDQLAGGFHRYATDRAWKVPHFEKMLYDNGQLLEIYARDYARTGDRERERILRETASFFADEMTAPSGGLWSAIDAEVEGREGGHHAWTLEAITEALGEEDASFLAPILGFAGDPFFDGEYVLHLPASFAEQAKRRRLDEDELIDQVKALEAKLLAARRERPMPLVDDKILTDWNGLAIAGLATAGLYLEDAGLVEQARRAADFVLAHLRGEDGTLRHVWHSMERHHDGGNGTGAKGEARFDAFLSDYVFFVRGLLALHEATLDERWLDEAERLTREQCDRLEDAENGGFFAAGERPDVLFRSKEIFDGALPSTNAAAVLNFLELAERAENDEWLETAAHTLRAFALYVEKEPGGARMLALATRRYHRLVEAPSAEEASRATVANLVEKAARAVVSARVELALDATPGAAPDAENWRRFTLHLEIKPGWHLDADTTRLDADGGVLRSVEWPSRERYAGSVEISGEWRGAGDPGEPEPQLRLGFQPCDDSRCLVPVMIDIPLMLD